MTKYASKRAKRYSSVLCNNGQSSVNFKVLSRSLYYCLFAPHIYIAFLRGHSVRGESHILTQHQSRGCNSICNQSV